MNEKEKPFTVADRRHFTPEGQPREGEEAREGERAPEGGEGAPRPSGPAAPVDFAQFVLSLGAQAGMLLSENAADKPAERASALEGARSLISILEMLRDKTEGRRTPDEDHILESLLFELRMAFVERTRAGQR
jgi:hypothetical protein